MADGGGFFDGFKAGSIGAPLVFAVVGSFGTGGDDERVIGEDAAIEERDGFRDGIEIMGFAEKDFGVFLVAKDGAKGSGNLSGRKRAGGDLVEKRLEEMEVALVDEDEFGVGAFEGLRGDQAAEAAANDKDAMLAGHISPSAAQKKAYIVPEGRDEPLFR